MSEAPPVFYSISGAPEGARTFWTNTSDGFRLRVAVWGEGTRGTVILFPGRSEFIEKYGRVIARLVARGLSVAAIDWRGQGLSDRYPSNPHLGHVEDFRDYQRDVTAMLSLEAVAELPRPFYLLAHSMGGTIGFRTLLEGSDFSGAILSAPMWHLQMRAATRELTTRMTRLANLVGIGTRLMPGAQSQPTPIAVSFKDNSLTSDPDTYAWCLNQVLKRPELAIGGPSMQWTYAALEEMARLYVAPLPALPVLVFLGGDETVVSSSVIRSQVKKMPNGELVELDQARHEILMERPNTLVSVWSHIDGFFESVPEPRARAITLAR
jgi:lysophospholipase